MHKEEMGFVVLFILSPCVRRVQSAEMILGLGGGLAGADVVLVTKIVCRVCPRCFLWAEDRADPAKEKA